MNSKFQNNNYRNNSYQGNKPYQNNNRNNVQRFRGEIHYPQQPVNSEKFQINSFDNVVSFRFNVDFVKQFVSLCKEPIAKINSEFCTNLVDDMTEIILLEEECFISEEYHLGKCSGMIYLNLGKKFFSEFCSIVNSFQSFPPAMFKFRDILSKIYFASNHANSNREENF
jgi:hypothetical protein